MAARNWLASVTTGRISHPAPATSLVVTDLLIERDTMPDHFSAAVRIPGLSLDIVAAISVAQAAVRERVPLAVFSGWSRRGLGSDGLKLYFYAFGLNECTFCGAIGCPGFDCVASRDAMEDER